jgi:hypothetical protein
VSLGGGPEIRITKHNNVPVKTKFGRHEDYWTVEDAELDVPQSGDTGRRDAFPTIAVIMAGVSHRLKKMAQFEQDGTVYKVHSVL